MEPRIVDGDLLNQDVEVIVNAWNRNIIPWWLLLPQGVSGAIKRRGGLEPFRELGRKGAIPLGGAVETGARRLPFRSIIHAAGINLLWRSSDRSIRDAVRNSVALAKEKGYRSTAFPLIGAGTGPARVGAARRRSGVHARRATFHRVRWRSENCLLSANRLAQRSSGKCR
jgi:O-acetyl-ADP-ribose deacetylase (regulator of RNase III)